MHAVCSDPHISLQEVTPSASANLELYDVNRCCASSQSVYLGAGKVTAMGLFLDIK